jgi:glycogen(starch) synthase
MRILLVAARYLPHRGGLESVASHLAQEFRRAGHEVLVVTHRWPRTLPAREVIEGVPVQRLFFIYPTWEHLRRGRLDLFLAGCWYSWYSTCRLALLIGRFQPDVVGQQYLGALTLSLWVLHHLARFPWVISLHGGDVDGEPRQNRFRRWLFGAATVRAGVVTACSAHLARQAKAVAPALAGRVQVVPNGVSLKRFQHAVPYPYPRPYALAVGQLVEHKGFDLLLRAWASATQGAPRVDLLLAGDGPARAALEALAAQLGLRGRVHFLGRVDEDRVASLMAGCRFVAMPSRRESFGIVALEALAAGKPLLATPVGGLPEFADLPGNCLVPPEEALWSAALADFLARYGGDPPPAPLAKSRQHAAAFAWPIIAGRYLRLYEAAKASR